MTAYDAYLTAQALADHGHTSDTATTADIDAYLQEFHIQEFRPLPATFTDPNPRETANILDQAADYVTRVGLNQGMWWGGDPLDIHNCPVCISGAVSAIVYGSPATHHGTPEQDTLRRRAWNALRKRLLLGSSPVTWNDIPGRTVEDVVGFLRSTAEALRRLADGIPTGERRPVEPVRMQGECL
ncbi:hypothetical protein [Streptomyces sp. CS081A]|uniref:DUF6197 family protein n=1 Tax=Streptomyces sp. CS081A TaxID=2162709 RepID=UPI000D51D0F7|nr:hypothetical protein [Streptomyces sp. CS081A]PVC73505.1 hypothetical protein DBP18_14255 [Streptomyces sp. CS081A]